MLIILRSFSKRYFLRSFKTTRRTEDASVKPWSVCQSRVESQDIREKNENRRDKKQDVAVDAANAYIYIYTVYTLESCAETAAVIIININQKVHSVRGASCARNNVQFLAARKFASRYCSRIGNNAHATISTKLRKATNAHSFLHD